MDESRARSSRSAAFACREGKQVKEDWIEVVVGSSVALAEGVASELVEAVEAAQGGVQVRKDTVVFWVHPPDLEATIAEVRRCMQKLQGMGWNVDPDRVRAGVLAPEEEWRDAWKKHFHVTRLTRQIVVVPSWESYEAKDTDLIVDLDPGQAFGTGAHASTQLVLEELQELVDSPDYSAPETIFDLGTGSGILAIAAAKFWPGTQITATDIDPLSISATNENAEQNGVQERIQVSTTALTEIEPRFPLVLANIQAHILRDLRDDLLPRLQSGGRLLISGILSSQIHSLSDEYCKVEDIELVTIRKSKLNPDWSSAHFLRR
jgi:ribosomal protein L11 methyltransferase